VCSDECRKIINEININKHETIEERRARHRKHARELRQTETGYLKETYRRMMSRLKGGITFEEMCNFYNSTNKCFYCGKKIIPFTVDKQIDHKIPVSRGGKNNIENLAICCKSCNSGKCDMTDSEYIKYRSRKLENS
jgi:5-methylcytosine-specific restriction endonuclease McrA